MYVYIFYNIFKVLRYKHLLPPFKCLMLEQTTLFKNQFSFS